MQTIPQHDHSHNSSEDGANSALVPSSVHVDGQQTSKYISSHTDDCTLVTFFSPQSSFSSPTPFAESSPIRASSSPVVDDAPRVKRSRSVSSHSSTDIESEDERSPKRHHSDESDADSVMNEERTHESVILKYGEHAIRVLTTNDGTRVVVAKDFLLLTGISKENCARTTKNLIEGRDKRMMHVPSNYCMMKGQQAVVLTSSGLSQLLVTSRRLKQSTALQSWIKQTLMPVLQGKHITTHNTHKDHHVHMQPQTQTSSPTQTKNKRTMVTPKRSKSTSPSTSPALTPSSNSPVHLSPSHSPRALSHHSSSSDSRDELTSAPHSPLQDLSTAAAMLNIAPITQITVPVPNTMSSSGAPAPTPAYVGFPMSTGFSTRIPTFPYRRATPLMGLGIGLGMGMGLAGVPRFTHPAAHKLGVRAVGA